MSHHVKSHRGPLPQRLEWVYLDSRSYESEYAQHLKNPASLSQKMEMIAELLGRQPHLLSTKSRFACKTILCDDPRCRFIHSFAVFIVFNRIVNEKMARRRNQIQLQSVPIAPAKYANPAPFYTYYATCAQGRLTSYWHKCPNQVKVKENPHPEGQTEENQGEEITSEARLLQIGFEAGASFLVEGCQSKKWKKTVPLLPLESPKKSSSLTEH
jgi:hypothetical protein